VCFVYLCRDLVMRSTMPSNPLILILHPQPYWAVVSAELKRVSSLGRFMSVLGTVRSELLTADSPEELRKLTELCADLQLENLYVRYANRKLFRQQKDFWESKDPLLMQHVKAMADKKLLHAIILAKRLDIPVIYAPTEQSPLHVDERLQIDETTKVTPVMNFSRDGQGTRYVLQLRLDDCFIITPSAQRLVVLGYKPGFFILDGRVLLLDEGFSAKLLLPFVSKTMVQIPPHLEKDYFHRFILKNVSKAEIIATGFDIDDTNEQPSTQLMVERSLAGEPLLTLRFRYGDMDYAMDSKLNGRVQLQDTGDGFRFIRSMRNLEKERQAVEAVRRTGAALSDGGYLQFRTMAGLIDWLRQYGPQLRQQGIEVVQPSECVYYIGMFSVEQNDMWQGDWLQTNVTVVLDEGRLRIPFRDLRDTILRGEQDYILPTGERLLIPQEWLQRYSNLLLTGQPFGKGFRRHRSQLNEELRMKNEKSILNLSSPPLPPSLKNATLRPYQLTGYEWLWQNFMAQTGCCLADEMGLGKTLQTIALLLKYKEVAKDAPCSIPPTGMLFSEEEMRGTSHYAPFLSEALAEARIPYYTSLVVAPASVTHNWMNELQRFAPSLLVCNYTGDTSTRRVKRTTLTKWDVVVTTYRTLLNDIEQLAPLQFGIVVFDESQAFKTPSSQIHQAVCRLTSLHRLALSGTPVENNLDELWSLMSVLNSNLLGSHRAFQQNFVAPIARQMEQQRAEVLQRLIAPYFLKRTKDQVLSDLPERQDEVVVCPMTENQAVLYAEELSKARNEYLLLQNPNSGLQLSNHNSQFTILNSLQRLRHIANGEGKMQVVFERLESLRGTHHKALLFSEYVTLLETVGGEMEQRGWSYELLTGQTQRREQVINHFQNDTDCQFFLISLKAGGVGLNLTAADYVFVLDPWWNLAAEEQAIARSHRIGQHQPVFVYRFVSENTLEQQILTLQERKQTLIDSVMPFICK